MPTPRWREHIGADPTVLGGKPVIKGTRLAVQFVVELLAGGWTVDQVVANYPDITRQDVLACLAHANARVRGEST